MKPGTCSAPGENIIAVLIIKNYDYIMCKSIREHLTKKEYAKFGITIKK